jgi:hypothetical protein
MLGNYRKAAQVLVSRVALSYQKLASYNVEYGSCSKFLNILRMQSPGMLRDVTLLRTDFSKERSAFIIRVTGIG